jgi:D-alanine-D-alanine ligase
LFDLPAEKTSWRVALVYNQKKEDTTRQPIEDDTVRQPASAIAAADVHGQVSLAAPLALPSHDLYAEWDTAETIEAVRAALAERHDVTLIEADEQCYGHLADERPEIIFNIAEGLYGITREAQMPAMFEMLRIPYTGSDPLTLAVCLDKSRAKEILSYYNIPTPRFSVLTDPSQFRESTLEYPCMVKPLHEGSSKGIFNSSLVTNRRELEVGVAQIVEQYREPAIVEEYLPGREFTVAMMGNGADLRVLPVVEIKFDSLPEGVNPIYSYEAKWIWDRAEDPLDIFECPAELNPRLLHDIESMCRRAYTILRCRDWCRIDVRLDALGVPHILELNPLPGILPNPEDNSCFPKAARAAGMSYQKLIQTVLDLAAQRSDLAGPPASLLTAI